MIGTCGVNMRCESQSPNKAGYLVESGIAVASQPGSSHLGGGFSCYGHVAVACFNQLWLGLGKCAPRLWYRLLFWNTLGKSFC